MIFRQITHDDLGCASYLIGDASAGVAAIVDPKLDIDDYLALAAQLGVRIGHVLETHNHADHVSGHGRLAAATGATIHIHRDAAAEYPHEPFDDGWELTLGSLVVRALHTPGHRPEHTAFVLVEARRSEEPWAVLTGDTLLIGDVARPDLAVERVAGARTLFASLHERLLRLPATCEVWPGHLGGSLCGGPGLDHKVCSTIGFEAEHNPLLAERDAERFIAATTTALPARPPNVETIVARNRGRWPDHEPAVQALTPHALALAGALVVDVRSAREFAGAHIPGAVCVPAQRAGFATKLAWVAGDAHPIALVGRDDAEAVRAARLAQAVAVDGAVVVLAGGMASWHAEGRPTATMARVDVAALRDRHPDLQVLDVREPAEWAAGHIPGARNTPYRELHRLPAELDPERPVAVVCATGQRAAIGASLIARLGAAQVLHVADGGVSTWHDRGWPLEREPAGGR